MPNCIFVLGDLVTQIEDLILARQESMSPEQGAVLPEALRIVAEKFNAVRWEAALTKEEND